MSSDDCLEAWMTFNNMLDKADPLSSTGQAGAEVQAEAAAEVGVR